MADMRLVVAGAGGRMGQTLIRLIASTPGVVLAGAVDRRGSTAIGQDAGKLAGLDPAGLLVTDDPLELLAQAEGVLDFTAPAATVELSALAAQMRIAHVIGTTGLSEADEARIKAAARHAPIVKSGNMSLGVNLLAAVIRQIAATLDESFDIEILEMHHNRKVDAPSGTALLLAAAAAQGRGIALSERSERVRDGHVGARRRGDIGFASLRGGNVVGDHTVVFAGEGERIELTHRADSRDLFARGALRAALWARGRKPGLYGMADVLDLGAAR
jgi:4-hydroxy-tetrahydrodipicolinate reductase